jgi:hypothetical protein
LAHVDEEASRGAVKSNVLGECWRMLANVDELAIVDELTIFGELANVDELAIVVELANVVELENVGEDTTKRGVHGAVFVAIVGST